MRRFVQGIVAGVIIGVVIASWAVKKKTADYEKLRNLNEYKTVCIDLLQDRIDGGKKKSPWYGPIR